MKNKILPLLSVFVILLCLASCKNSSALIDSEGCFIDMNSAIEDARKNNREILVLITAQGEGTSAENEDFLNSVLKTEDFKTRIASKYTVMHANFTDELYEGTLAKDESKAAKKVAEENQNLLNGYLYLVQLLMPEQSPAYFLMSKDEYMLTEIKPQGELNSAEDFENAINQYSDVVVQIENLIEKTKSNDESEKIKAINDLFEGTYPYYRVFLADLVEQGIKLDKNNQYGYLSKFLLADAENSAFVAYTEQNLEAAVSAYLNICTNEFLEPIDKQQAYYMAAYYLMFSGSTDITEITQYLQYAIQAYPEGPDVPVIQQTIDAIAASYDQNRGAQISN